MIREVIAKRSFTANKKVSDIIDGTFYIENDIPYMFFCHGGSQAKRGDTVEI